MLKPHHDEDVTVNLRSEIANDTILKVHIPFSGVEYKIVGS